MADTIREQIISAIVTRVGTIRTVNGYNSECGQEVKRAIKDLEPDDLPAVVVWPQPELADRKYGQSVCVMDIKVEAFFVFGATNPSIIQEILLGDIIKCMTNPAVVHPFIDDIYYKEGGPTGQPEAGEVTTGASATFEIKYSYKLGNPYEQ